MASAASPLSGHTTATPVPATVPGAEPPNVLRQRKATAVDADEYRADDESGESDKDREKSEVTWGKTPSGQGE